jgi:phosphatidylethanolamine/phosphatidyl-N-methylethanolamine N-methyltransferase
MQTVMTITFFELCLVFAVSERGRHLAIAAAERIGGRILVVGVGTGLSLAGDGDARRLSAK